MQAISSLWSLTLLGALGGMALAEVLRPGNIGAPLPLGEGCTGGAFGAVLYGALGPVAEVLPYGLLGLLLIEATRTDLRHRVVPNRLILVGGVLGLLLMGAEVLAWETSLGGALGGAVLLGTVRAAGHLAFGEPGMGMGDVKLAALVGMYLGWSVLWVLYLAGVVGACWGLCLWAAGPGRARHLPFAPCMAAGAVLYGVLPLDVLWGGL